MNSSTFNWATEGENTLVDKLKLFKDARGRRGFESKKNLFSPTDARELDILNDIALYLDHSEHDAVAAALDKHKGSNEIQLILARNSKSDAEDENRTTLLLNLIQAKPTFRDILDFAIVNSTDRIKAKIRKVSDIDMCLVNELLSDRGVSEHLEKYQGPIRSKWPSISSDDLLRNVLDTVQTIAKTMAQPQTLIEMDSFLSLAHVRFVLRTLDVFVDEHIDSRTEAILQLAKLGRRLKKIFVYYTAAKRMAASAKFLPSTIVHTWLSNTDGVHAEIQIAKYLNDSDDPIFVPLGCSKESCVCCHVWLESWNNGRNSLCIISGGNGNSFVDWQLPGYSTSADRAVIDHVDRALGLVPPFDYSDLRSLMDSDSD